MAKTAAENITVGMGIKTWFGTHTVIRIIPYTGPFDHVINTLVFSNGARMSNEQNARYVCAQ